MRNMIITTNDSFIDLLILQTLSLILGIMHKQSFRFLNIFGLSFLFKSNFKHKTYILLLDRLEIQYIKVKINCYFEEILQCA